MKKYFYIATIAAFMLSGCEDFLDTENYTKKNTGNFPETVEDIDIEYLDDKSLKGIISDFLVRVRDWIDDEESYLNGLKVDIDKEGLIVVVD